MADPRPTVIGLAGGTGSGKTTITEALLARLRDDAVLLQHDWYYRDQADVPVAQRSEVNYDHPDAQETDLLVKHVEALQRGETIHAPQYDFAVHTRSDSAKTIAPRSVIVVEGINTLANESLRRLCDVTVFVDTPADIRFLRRLERDVADRGRTMNSVIAQYVNQVRPMHDRYVEPCKSRADLVLSGEAEVTLSVDAILEVLRPGSSGPLLLLSNSTMAGEAYLSWAAPQIVRRIEGVKEALFVPYAAVDRSYDAYTASVAQALGDGETRIVGVHNLEDPVAALREARCIIVGGGNTFALLATCQRLGLMVPMRRAVQRGAAYIGWSAGANLACPTIKTTNDMPIECPKDFDGLGLVSFQINPHYTSATVAGHGGESRDQRLREYALCNPDVPVIGLPEGMFIALATGAGVLHGDGEAVLFCNDTEAQRLKAGILDLRRRG